MSPHLPSTSLEISREAFSPSILREVSREAIFSFKLQLDLTFLLTVYKFLKSSETFAAVATEEGDILWNFGKFLVGKDGQVVQVRRTTAVAPLHPLSSPFTLSPPPPPLSLSIFDE